MMLKYMLWVEDLEGSHLVTWIAGPQNLLGDHGDATANHSPQKDACPHL